MVFSRFNIYAIVSLLLFSNAKSKILRTIEAVFSSIISLCLLFGSLLYPKAVLLPKNKPCFFSIS